MNRPRLNLLEEEDYGAAPELAEFLVRKGHPFQDAHRIVGRMVLKTLESGRKLKELSLEETRGFSPDFDAEAIRIVSSRRPAARAALPASHPRRIKANLQRWKKVLGAPPKGRKR